MGGDVDSLAAITTGILAAKHGIKSLPQFMIEHVEGKQKLIDLAAKMKESNSIFLAL